MKEGHQGVVAQLYSLDVQTSKPSISLDLYMVIDQHYKVFEDIPKRLPPTRYYDHAIHLIIESIHPNIKPYRYPYAQKREIGCMVEEMLEANIIGHSQSSYFATMVMVHNKEGSWCMCLNYIDLHKITIKGSFPILVTDELLEKLGGEVYFTRLDLHSRYHQLIFKEEDIPIKTFKTDEGHYEFVVMPFGLTNSLSIF